MPRDRVEAAHFSPDIQDFIRLLYTYGVKYLIISGVTFDEAWPASREVTLASEEEDVPLFYIGLENLIANKRASGRPTDLEDLAYPQRASQNDDR